MIDKWKQFNTKEADTLQTTEFSKIPKNILEYTHPFGIFLQSWFFFFLPPLVICKGLLWDETGLLWPREELSSPRRWIWERNCWINFLVALLSGHQSGWSVFSGCPCCWWFVLRRFLQGAWDLGYSEPSQHHVAMPAPILCAMVSLATMWLAATCWLFGSGVGGIVTSRRTDLCLQTRSAAAFKWTIRFALLSIQEPKSMHTSGGKTLVFRWHGFSRLFFFAPCC